MNLPIVVGILAVIAVIVAIIFIKRMLIFLLNSVIGLFALLGWNIVLPLWAVDVNTWSVLLVAILGIFGLAGVVALHLLGIAF